MVAPGGYGSISVVVPVYNGALTLPDLVSGLNNVLPQVAAAYEIILVNDGSLDESWQRIRALAGQYPLVRGFNLLRNYGQHNALLCGIREARYDIVATLDDDLQHPPDQLPALLAKLDEGYDVVYGTPLDEQHGLWRDLASQITKLALESAVGASTARQVSAYRVFRTRLRNAFEAYRSPDVSIDVLLTWSTTRFAAIPVRHAPRLAGKSNYSFQKLLLHAINMLTGYSTLPLRLASMVGFAFTLFGFLVLVYVIGRYLLQGGSVPVPGFTFLASLIAILSGVQLFSLGIIGEYMARMYVRLMERPAYSIGDTVWQEPAGVA